MRFGIFDSFDVAEQQPGEVLADRLAFAVETERLGFTSYHVTEHHGTPLSACPSPNIFLAALSQRTSQIRIGALVNVLPAYDPFRLAEEIATLDQLSGGRIEFGVGAGVSPIELSIFGVEGSRAKAIYTESLTAITGALRTGHMRHDGTLLRSYDAELSILPVQRPYPPVWYASSNSATAEWAGTHAVNFVGRWNGGAMKELVDTYWTAFATNTGNPDRLNPHVTDPSIGTSSPLVVAESDEKAREIFTRANDLFHDRVNHLWHRVGDHRFDKTFSSETMLANGAAFVGTAESVRDQIVAQVEHSGINYLEVKPLFGDIPLADAVSSARVLTEFVGPALQGLGAAGEPVSLAGRSA